MNELGITDLGQVFIPPEHWGPFSTPVDLVYAEGIKLEKEKQDKRLAFWKGLVVFILSVIVILGILFLLTKWTDGQKS